MCMCVWREGGGAGVEAVRKNEIILSPIGLHVGSVPDHWLSAWHVLTELPVM